MCQLRYPIDALKARLFMTQKDIVFLPQPTTPAPMEFRFALGTACRHSKPVIVDCRQSVLSVGTVVLIGIGNRLFAATAKHCLEHAPSLLLSKHFQVPCQPYPALAVGYAENRDIGYIEIANDPELLRLTLDNLCDQLPPVPANPEMYAGPYFFIVGYPASAFTKVAGVNGVWVKNFSTFPCRVSRDEYVCHYPVSLTHFSEESSECEAETVEGTPHGYSGGGVWSLHEGMPGQLTIPSELIRLHAIQTQWDPSMRTVKSIPISRWLELVYRKYPDLRELIASSFPSVAEHD